MGSNRSDQFERLPATEEDREVEGRPTEPQIIEYWTDRFGTPPEIFDGYTFWEKGAGKIWALHHSLPSPVEIEALGMPILRTRQEFWKPTTDGALRFGDHATRNVIELTGRQAERFLAGTDQEVAWDGDWGYLIASHELAGDPAPIGVGLYTYSELKSMIPKGRRRTFSKARDDQ